MTQLLARQDWTVARTASVTRVGVLLLWLSSPTAESCEQVVQPSLAERFERDFAERAKRRAHLLEVNHAIRALFEMRVEAFAIGLWKIPFEVARDDLDELVTIHHWVL